MKALHQHVRTGWRLNFGSGKSFREDCLNIDCNPLWQPDILADLTLPFPPSPETVYATSRFGDVQLLPGCAGRILAHDLLEHLPALTVCYESCLGLLQEGGVLEVHVPYDLSLGAWQDPTHVRAFNENSWLYVTDWHWYLGWEEARFELESLEFRHSVFGQGLLEQGLAPEEVRRQPRAVDSMAVLLRKRATTPKERAKARERMARYQLRPDGFAPAAVLEKKIHRNEG